MVFALYFATVVAVSHAAAEGARASVRGVTTATRSALARARVQTIMTSYSPLLNAQRVTVTPAVGAPDATTFRVTVAYPVSDFNFQSFYALLNFVTGGASAAPTTISRTVTIGNGGYLNGAP